MYQVSPVNVVIARVARMGVLRVSSPPRSRSPGVFHPCSLVPSILPSKGDEEELAGDVLSRASAYDFVGRGHGVCTRSLRIAGSVAIIGACPVAFSPSRVPRFVLRECRHGDRGHSCSLPPARKHLWPVHRRGATTDRLCNHAKEWPRRGSLAQVDGFGVSSPPGGVTLVSRLRTVLARGARRSRCASRVVEHGSLRGTATKSLRAVSVRLMNVT